VSSVLGARANLVPPYADGNPSRRYGLVNDVGDAVVLDNEVWLVLREAERAAVRGHARYLCRRALQLRVEAEELIAHAKALQLKFTEVREVSSP